MFESFYLYLLITILSLIILFAVDRLIESNIKQFIFFIFFCESTVLTFFFDKYPNYFSFIVLIFSIILAINNNLLKPGQHSTKRFSSVLFHASVTKLLSVTLILAILIYEYFSDRNLSQADLLVTFLAIILYFYDSVPYKYGKELDFLVIFFLSIAIFLILPQILHKIVYQLVGQDSEGWIDNSLVVNVLLARPLANMLNILGFVSHAEGTSVYFENIESGLYESVSIAEGCSGIVSVQIFVAGLVSFVVTEKKDFYFATPFLLLGIIISYFANLLRMAIIVIVGHYMGRDMLGWTHQNVGWVIFSIWIFIFYSVLYTYTIKNNILEIENEQ